MTIIWDFNGTLLNDMQVCVDCMNILLEERALPPIGTEQYREIFTFPVKEYYIHLGFDFEKEDFEVPAHRFIDLYRERLPNAPLHDEVKSVMDHFRKKGYRQVVLSAMEQEFLDEAMRSKGIEHYFDRIAGITDHLGEGKNEMARSLIGTLPAAKSEIIMIGDTLHDYEVSQANGIRCILITHGHQSLARLNGVDCPKVSNFNELKDLIDRIGQES